jgi:hypothetical protein
LAYKVNRIFHAIGPWAGPFWALARYRAMIAITISAEAYAAIAPAPQAGSSEPAIAPGREYRVWLSRDLVIRLRALRGPGETFSDVILRLKDSDSFAALMRQGFDSGSNA